MIEIEVLASALSEYLHYIKTGHPDEVLVFSIFGNAGTIGHR